MRSFKQHLLLFSKGLAMGAADVVPGVSGGTIAFVSGIYMELINQHQVVEPSGAQSSKVSGIGSCLAIY